MVRAGSAGAAGELENVSPVVVEVERSGAGAGARGHAGEHEPDELDAEEVFQLVRDITDPEHPLTLEQLRVVRAADVRVDGGEVTVTFTPTIPHCSMATLIGLSIKVQLLRCLPSRYKITVEVTEGSHMSEHAVNKQLADKERVAAALENNNLIKIINQCIYSNF